MNLFIELHQDLINKLLASKVDFIIIGGYSVIFHGYRRTTGDIDIWLQPSNENRDKLLSVLRQFDLEDEDIEALSAVNFTKHTVFSMGEQPEKIDFLTHINLIKYEDADKKKVIAEVNGMQVPFLHIDDLVLSKMNTGRPKDIADLDMLQLIREAKNNKI